MAIVLWPRDHTPFSGSRLRVSWGHPLAQGLIGAWQGNAQSSGFAGGNSRNDPSIELAFGQVGLVDNFAAVPTTYRATPGGAMRAGASVTLNALPTRLLPSSNFTLFWYGLVTGNTSSFGAYIWGISYTASPNDACTIYRGSNNTDVGFFMKASGTNYGPAATVISASDYGINPMSLAVTFGTSTVVAYKNGLIVGSSAGTTNAVTYGATNLLGAGCTGGLGISSPLAGTALGLGLIWNRPLTPTDHLMLARNPYQMFIPSRRLASSIGSGGGGGVNQYERMWRGVGVGVTRGAR